jgi:hypothetical protein
MITLLVGDITEYLAVEACKIAPQAKLVNEHNYTNLSHGVYYTSLGDFSTLYNFIQTIDQAQHLIYCPPLIWSDEKKSFSYMKFWTEYYLLYFFKHKQITHNNKLPLLVEQKNIMLELADSRKVPHKQLWVSGCSVSHGVGVNPQQRYGQLLANEMNLDVSFLTCSGSSIQWAADQIIRSDIRANDIVVWGVTSFARMPYYMDQKIQHINALTYKLKPDFNRVVHIDLLDDDNIVYRNLTCIHAVINFCNKIQAKLFLFGLLIDQHTIKWTADLPHYTQLYGRFAFDNANSSLDLGTDNQHPGPDMHQWYYQQMLQILKG